LDLDLNSGGVGSRPFARLATTFTTFAPPLGTIGGLPQRRNGRRQGYDRFLNGTQLDRL
jgi:hypothetical protein